MLQACLSRSEPQVSQYSYEAVYGTRCDKCLYVRRNRPSKPSAEGFCRGSGATSMLLVFARTASSWLCPLKALDLAWTNSFQLSCIGLLTVFCLGGW